MISSDHADTRWRDGSGATALYSIGRQSTAVDEGAIRRPGRVHGAAVRNRIIAYNLRFLLAVLNWPTVARESGIVPLERNALKGTPAPGGDEPAPAARKTRAVSGASHGIR
jgi:hypothetical protein